MYGRPDSMLGQHASMMQYNRNGVHFMGSWMYTIRTCHHTPLDYIAPIPPLLPFFGYELSKPYTDLMITSLGEIPPIKFRHSQVSHNCNSQNYFKFVYTAAGYGFSSKV